MLTEGQQGQVTSPAGWSVRALVLAVGLHSFAVSYTPPDGAPTRDWFSSDVRIDGGFKRHGEPADQARRFIPDE